MYFDVTLILNLTNYYCCNPHNVNPFHNATGKSKRSVKFKSFDTNFSGVPVLTYLVCSEFWLILMFQIKSKDAFRNRISVYNLLQFPNIKSKV